MPLQFSGYSDLVSTARAIIEAPFDAGEQEVDRLLVIDEALDEDAVVARASEAAKVAERAAA